MLLPGMVSISSRHGLSIYTPSCMVAYAAIPGTVGNFEGARETTKTALASIDTIEGMDVMAHSTILGVANLLTPWFPNTSLEDIHPRASPLLYEVHGAW